MNAVRLSSAICAAPFLPKGLGALATWGRASIAQCERWIAALLSASVTLPAGGWKTIGLLPFCCGGKRSASRSVAAWLSVPGSSRLLEVLPPSVRIASKSTPTATTQAARTTHL